MPTSAGNRRKSGQPAMHTPAVVSPQAWEAARKQLLVKEKAQPAPVTPGRRAPANAVAGCREGVCVRGACRQGQSARPVRRPASADRLSRLLRAGSVRLARPRLPRLLDGGRPGRPRRPPERPRHDPRLPLACTSGGHRAAEGANGLGDAVVHSHGQLRRRLRRGRVAWDKRVLPRRRSRVPHLLHQQPRRRADGEYLELPRHHAAGPAGDLGGRARGLSPDPALQVVELARQLRRRRSARQEVGRGIGRRRGGVPEPAREREACEVRWMELLRRL